MPLQRGLRRAEVDNKSNPKWIKKCIRRRGTRGYMRGEVSGYMKGVMIDYKIVGMACCMKGNFWLPREVSICRLQ